MSILKKLAYLFQDAPPDFVFELSEAGIAYSRINGEPPTFVPLEEGTLHVSPLADNVLKSQVLVDQVRAIVGTGSGRRKRNVILILPDFCARVAILDFTSFPSDPKEQISLVRFRMKRSVPFDLESAVVGYHALPARTGGGKGIQVVVVATLLEIIARYEAPFRVAGLHPGFITTSALAVLDLLVEPETSVLARLIGRQLTVTVTTGNVLKLIRSVELSSTSHDELMGVLFPTIAYIEDEMKAKPERLYLCGFGESANDGSWQMELDVPVQPLQSRFGSPTPYNAGLLGYLHGLSAFGVKVA